KLLEPAPGKWVAGLCPDCTAARVRRTQAQPQPLAAPKPKPEDATTKRLASYLSTIAGNLPGIWRGIDQSRERQTWPQYVYLPVRHYPEAIRDNPALPCLAAWRATQGIYRFDADVLPALWDTPVGDLPIQALHAIPEWCVYIDCAAMQISHPASGHPVLG